MLKKFFFFVCGAAILFVVFVASSDAELMKIFLAAFVAGLLI